MNIKNLLIFGTIGVIVLVLSYISLSSTATSVKHDNQARTLPEDTLLVKKKILEKKTESPLSSLAKSKHPLSQKNVHFSEKTSFVQTESNTLESVSSKKYGLLTIKERNNLPEEERLSKLYDLIDDWETIPSTEQKKIVQNIKRQWQTLPEEDQSIIKTAWHAYQEQQGIVKTQLPERTSAEIMDKLNKRMEARKRGEKPLMNMQ